MNKYEAIRILAFKSVSDPDEAAIIRRILRWYSETFATPLMKVYDIPIDFVLQHYFEHMYERIEGPEAEKELEDLLLTPEERKKRDRDEEDKKREEKESFDRFVKETAAEAKKSKTEEKQEVEDIPDLPTLPPGVELKEIDMSNKDNLFNDLLESDSLTFRNAPDDS